jgi:ATP-dependent Clp protease, protease subunit
MPAHVRRRKRAVKATSQGADELDMPNATDLTQSSRSSKGRSRSAKAVKAPTPREGYVHFTREFNGDTAESLLDAVTRLANEGVPRVVLCLASPGGWIPKAMAVYNMLRAFPVELVTHAVGEVASAGNMPFLAGEVRYACPHATFMLHPGSFNVRDAELDAKSMRERIDRLDACDERERLIVKERTNLTAAQVRRLVQGSTTLTASDAVNAGIVHQIKQLKIPRGARIVTAGRPR